MRDQNYNDKAFEAKLHGFKMSAPIVEQRWSAQENEALSAVAMKRFEEMQKRANEVRGSV